MKETFSIVIHYLRMQPKLIESILSLAIQRKNPNLVELTNLTNNEILHQKKKKNLTSNQNWDIYKAKKKIKTLQQKKKKNLKICLSEKEKLINTSIYR